MPISIRTSSRVNHYITETTADGTTHEFEVPFQPIEWFDVLIHREGNKAVVAYLVQDECPGNPMKEFDGQGVIYTGGRNDDITDDRSAMLDALELGSDGEIDWDKMLTLEGKHCTLAEHVVDKVFNDLDVEETRCVLVWQYRYGSLDLSDSEFNELDENTMSDERIFELKMTHRDDIISDLLDPSGYHSDLMGRAITDLYAKHWQKIVGPWVLPIYYHSERGDTRICLTTWDGDTDELPDGVWIADRNVIGNLPDPTHPEFNERITEYAKAVLQEYEDWCNGNVFGCVVQTFQRADEDSDWQCDGDHDSCWGFIGDKHAQQSLRDEFFEPAVKRLQNDVTA